MDAQVRLFRLKDVGAVMPFVAVIGYDAALSGLVVVDSPSNYSAVRSLGGNNDCYSFKICW